MSGVLKALGRVFKKIAHVAKIVLPIALAAAAIVFTGGAALGILPAFSTVVGGLVGGLGLSTTLAGALTGSIVSAGFGAAAGLVTGGVKGAQKGALFGAATGGVLGALSPATFGVGSGASTAAHGATGAWDSAASAGAKGLAPLGIPGITDVGTAAGVAPIADSVGPGIVDTTGNVVPSAVDAAAKTAAGAVPASAKVAASVVPTTNLAPSAAAAATPASTGSPGLLTNLLNNPNALVMGGNLLSGLFTPSAAQEAAQNGDRLFNGVYSGEDPFGPAANYGTPRVNVATARRFRLNPQTLVVEEVRQ